MARLNILDTSCLKLLLGCLQLIYHKMPYVMLHSIEESVSAL